jgi:hypothetical protein
MSVAESTDINARLYLEFNADITEVSLVTCIKLDVKVHFKRPPFYCLILYRPIYFLKNFALFSKIY